jgi:hypothetical protein
LVFRKTDVFDGSFFSGGIFAMTYVDSGKVVLFLKNLREIGLDVF